MIVAYSRKAITDLRAIGAHMRSRNPAAAVAAIYTILDAIELTATFPRLGRRGTKRNTRELIIGGTPYIAVYRIRDDRVEILAVYHGAQLR